MLIIMGIECEVYYDIDNIPSDFPKPKQENIDRIKQMEIDLKWARSSCKTLIEIRINNLKK